MAFGVSIGGVVQLVKRPSFSDYRGCRELYSNYMTSPHEVGTGSCSAWHCPIQVAKPKPLLICELESYNNSGEAANSSDMHMQIIVGGATLL